jgi:5-formyltetrahydrofolate cyclo-ligase
MGIPEPVTDPCCNVEEIDLIIVPGVAFDETGGRIGYGGGYYDRLLPRVKGLRPIVALAYEEQIYDDLPRAEHDIEMDIVLTDRKTIRVIKEEEGL